jgi:hypothetical protein
MLGRLDVPAETKAGREGSPALSDGNEFEETLPVTDSA